MKTSLTRIGVGSKVVITGDITQIDLPEDKVSGLKVAMRVLEGIDDIAVCTLTGADVVRHRLVQKIIEAYEVYEKQHPSAEDAKPQKSGGERNQTGRSGNRASGGQNPVTRRPGARSAGQNGRRRGHA